MDMEEYMRLWGQRQKGFTHRILCITGIMFMMGTFAPKSHKGDKVVQAENSNVVVFPHNRKIQR